VPAAAFYLPGIAPIDYPAGAPIDVMANKLESPRSKLPYGYYSLPLCRVDGWRASKSRRVNLGQMLVGERSLPTPFDLRMMVPVKCATLCTVPMDAVPAKQLRALKARIRQDYSVRLNADNMPVVTRGRTKAGVPAFRFGYKLGYVDRRAAAPGEGGRRVGAPVYVNNHLRLTVLYHRPVLSPARLHAAAAAAREAAGGSPSPGVPEVFRVVGFEVEPMSAAHGLRPGEQVSPLSCAALEGPPSGAAPRRSPPQPVDKGETITFTYSVDFRESDLPWATRWDPLLAPNDQVKQIQWFSIVNSLMVGLFLTGLVAAVLFRTVLSDFARYRKVDGGMGDDDGEEAAGWKLVQGDVFRPPTGAPLLSVCVGSGSQVLVMAFCTQVLALLGFLSPANRGGLLSALLTLFVMASAVAGYATARVYMSMEGKTSRRTVTWGAAVLFPGISFGTFFLLNIAVALTGSSGSVGIWTLLVLLFMWFGVSLPLVFVGAFVGFRQKPVDDPVRTNQIPRVIPVPPCQASPCSFVLPAGIVPFGTVFMELVFLLNSVNQGSVHYLYGALMAVSVILVVTCAELSVVFTYLSLSAENWKWEWPAFLTTASSGVYVFAYAIYYLMSQPPLAAGGERAPIMSWVLYATYMAIVSGAFSLMCGSVGFHASRLFVSKIYARSRVD
jgi:transmembrane 9 superfamily member 2/4